MDIGMPNAAHFIFIPAVLIVGVVIGWVLGSRAAQDAMAFELKKREERREKSEARSQKPEARNLKPP